MLRCAVALYDYISHVVFTSFFSAIMLKCVVALYDFISHIFVLPFLMAIL